MSCLTSVTSVIIVHCNKPTYNLSSEDPFEVYSSVQT